MSAPGQVVILNGAPRSGKTSIARALQDASPALWVNLGVDASVCGTPPRFRPGIGLRPGGERPDLEDVVALLSAALYDSVAAHARLGVNVVVDVGQHDDYSRPLHLWRVAAAGLSGLPVLLVGVRCPVEEIWRRRAESWGQDRASVGGDVADAVARWQDAVHAGLRYDLEVDTSRRSPADCADLVAHRLELGPPGTALAEVADR
jgi:chloramphenicol 3-O phosphotransferase